MRDGGGDSHGRNLTFGAFINFGVVVASGEIFFSLFSFSKPRRDGWAGGDLSIGWVCMCAARCVSITTSPTRTRARHETASCAGLVSSQLAVKTFQRYGMELPGTSASLSAAPLYPAPRLNETSRTTRVTLVKTGSDPAMWPRRAPTDGRAPPGAGAARSDIVDYDRRPPLKSDAGGAEVARPIHRNLPPAKEEGGHCAQRSPCGAVKTDECDAAAVSVTSSFRHSTCF